ncbi:hypothetical protein [Streptomyces yangpuensis]|uniref:hypothetical protein n=1 Tax=Streptomyces yangpuensis TaxID=1648182 RepID=UPI00382261E7
MPSTDSRADFIDYAVACGPDSVERLPYRGPSPTPPPPEIATAVLSNPAERHIGPAGQPRTSPRPRRPGIGIGIG